MEIKPVLKKIASLQLLAVILTFITAILGAPFLRVLHRTFGSKYYWSSGFIIGALFWIGKFNFFSILWVAVLLVIGIYWELEKHGWCWKRSSMIAVGAAFVVSIAMLYGWSFVEHKSLFELGSSLIAPLSQKISISEIKLTNEDLVYQLPSVYAILLIISLVIGIVYERVVVYYTGLPFYFLMRTVESNIFRLPDICVWIGMFSFLFSFLQKIPKAMSLVSINVFNVMVLLFFLQGLAVIESYFSKIKIANLLRVIVYVFVIFQLFFIVSVLGFIDYWVDFRNRFSKYKPVEL